MVKKGFLKTLEVFLAVTSVLIFVMFVNSNNIYSNSDVEYSILSNLAKDDSFRENLYLISNVCYSKYENHSTIDVIKQIMPDYLNYTFCVYDETDFRIDTLPSKKILVDSYYFSSNDYIYSPKIARLFYWTE